MRPNLSRTGRPKEDCIRVRLITNQLCGKFKAYRRTKGEGLLSKIFSIFSRTSGVSFGITSSALRLSRTCSGFDAPRMTVLVLGLTANQARARWLILQPSSDRCACASGGVAIHR